MNSMPDISYSSSNNNSSSFAIENHYSRNNIGDTILSALQKTGKDVNALTVDDLAPIDEFHTRGRYATASLTELIDGGDKLKPNHHVLDVGSRIGAI
jgi:hypothetical protein